MEPSQPLSCFTDHLFAGYDVLRSPTLSFCDSNALLPWGLMWTSFSLHIDALRVSSLQTRCGAVTLGHPFSDMVNPFIVWFCSVKRSWIIWAFFFSICRLFSIGIVFGDPTGMTSLASIFSSLLPNSSSFPFTPLLSTLPFLPRLHFLQQSFPSEFTPLGACVFSVVSHSTLPNATEASEARAPETWLPESTSG